MGANCIPCVVQMHAIWIKNCKKDVAKDPPPLTSNEMYTTLKCGLLGRIKMLLKNMNVSNTVEHDAYNYENT